MMVSEPEIFLNSCTTLIGGACHATLPFMPQGVWMAIEDAAVLAECVSGAEGGALPAALERYEVLRRPRTPLRSTTRALRTVGCASLRRAGGLGGPRSTARERREA